VQLRNVWSIIPDPSKPTVTSSATLELFVFNCLFARCCVYGPFPKFKTAFDAAAFKLGYKDHMKGTGVFCMLELKREAKEKSKDEPTVTEQSQDTTGKTMVSLKTEESKTTINK